MDRWTRESVEQVLSDRGLGYQQQEIQYGIQYRLDDGPIVNLFESTGSVSVQGGASQLRTELQATFSGTNAAQVTETAPQPAMTQSASNRIFIVYGHDQGARDQLELFLRRQNLNPIILENIPGAGDTIIEKLETLTEADFACVLLTPDDEGHRRGHPEEIKPRARQNVVLELGMVLTRLTRQRVAILVKGPELERPSDIDGLIYIHFNSSVDEAKIPLAQHLEAAGFALNVGNLS